MDSSLGSSGFVRVAPEWRTTAPCECVGFPGQRPTSCDPLFAIWGAWRGDYEAAVDAFIAGPLGVQKIDLTLAAMTTQLRGAVQEAAGIRGAPTVEAWLASVESLRATIASVRQNRGAAY